MLHISALGQTVFALGALGFILHNLFDLSALIDAINIGTSLGNIAMYLGALPIGIVLLKRARLSKTAA